MRALVTEAVSPMARDALSLVSAELGLREINTLVERSSLSAGVRMTVPADVIARTSSRSEITSALTSEPRELSSIFAALIPIPPRP